MVKVPYFDEMEILLSPDYDPEKPVVSAALEAFLSLTSEDRLKDTRHVFAYYHDVRDVVGEEWLDEEMGVPTTPEDICVDSEVKSDGIPIKSRTAFRDEAGQHSEMKRDSIPINCRTVIVD